MLYKVARKITTTYLNGLSFADRTGGLVRIMNDHRKRAVKLFNQAIAVMKAW